MPSIDPLPPATSPSQSVTSPPKTHLCRGAGCNLCASGSTARAGSGMGASAAAAVDPWEFRSATSFGYERVEESVLNFSVKMIGTSPDQLPDNLRAELEGWMKVAPMSLQGYIRFGCLHLSVDVMVNTSEEAAAATANLSAGFADSVQRGAQHLPWCTNPTTGYFPSGVSIAAAGVVVECRSHSSSRPSIKQVRRLAVADGIVQLVASAMTHPCTKIHCRINGEFFLMPVEELQVVDESSGTAVVTARLPHHAGLGFAWLEVLCDAPEGFEVSEPAPLLVTDDPLISEELCALSDGKPNLGRNSLVKIMKGLGKVLEASAGSPVAASTCLPLAGFAASCGWAETMDRALDCALQLMTLQEALAAVEEHSGISLLSCAITSGSVPTVSRVLAFLAETGSFALAAVDTPSGRWNMSPMQWSLEQGVPDITDMLVALRRQNRSKIGRTLPLSSSSSSLLIGSSSGEPFSSGLRGAEPSEGVAETPRTAAPVARCLAQPSKASTPPVAPSSAADKAPTLLLLLLLPAAPVLSLLSRTFNTNQPLQGTGTTSFAPQVNPWLWCRLWAPY
eukprot:CAMPEP_0117694662 /NCGR_PEP_ID=MMETSP0804-20121206/27621_1 /TAXON_ID=1074897 /ORGANISM="Tetraselmis astigmatica, Strain CCMP880" /LENGTH=563 /DNA_ID=CAMNT_0005508473 /DNA_START=343 /DNA_END=2036 /DNA_ORIENTATION=-